MNVSGINDLIRRMEDALPRGNIYHINYQTLLTHTDAFYDRNRGTVKLLEDNHAQTVKNMAANPLNKDIKDPEDHFRNFVRAFANRLSDPREYRKVIDCSLDGTGFYLRQESSFINSEGIRGTDGPTIYASNGKIMGTFYSDLQAVIQPATERPSSGKSWDDIAYYFAMQKITTVMTGLTDLSVTNDEKEIVIAGELPLGDLAHSHLELHLDKSTLKPAQMMCIRYDRFGKLFLKVVKTWQFQDFSGVSLPKSTVEESYHADLQGNMKLEQVDTFTINEFSPQPERAEERLKGLLKSNYSVYDEITGSHYVAGNPEEILNKLSR